MPRVGREYITLDVSGEDQVQLRTIEQAILAAFGDRVAYQILRLRTEQGIEDARRDPAFILEASEGKLPVILVNITYADDGPGPGGFRVAGITVCAPSPR